MSTTLILLAGGESRRFGRDKALVLVDGEPSLSKIVEELTKLSTVDLLVVTRDYDRCKVYKSIIPIIECTVDRFLECSGPLRGVYSVSDRGSNYYYLAPVDTPWIKIEVYLLLTSYLNIEDADIAAVLHDSRHTDPLISVLTGRYFSEIHSYIENICRLRGYLRATDLIRAATTVVLVGSRYLARFPLYLSHINTEDDLKTRYPRNRLYEDIVLLSQPSLGLATSYKEFRKISRQQYYVYKNLRIDHLAIHAEKDYRS